MERFLEGDNLNTYTVINEELNKLSIWLASNKLTLNTDTLCDISQGTT